MSKPIIAITMGDPNGIGPELVIKTLSDEGVYDYCRPFWVAATSAIEETASRLGTDISIRSIDDVSQVEFSFRALDVLCPEGLEVPKINWRWTRPWAGGLPGALKRLSSWHWRKRCRGLSLPP